MSDTDTVSKDGTDGLETVAEAYINCDGECEEINYLHNGLPSADGFTELVTRSQAEAIIRDLETKILEAAMSDRFDDTGAPLTWQERAEKAEAANDELECEVTILRNSFFEEKEARIADNASKDSEIAELVHDLNRIKDHETELVNDNAELTARIKELEQINAILMGNDEDKPRYTTKRLKQEIACATETLEAKLAAAEKALETYRSTVKGVCESQRGTKWGKAAECIFDAIERAVLEVKSS